MNIRLLIEYDGTQYHGWQIQKNGITIEGVLSDALKKITKEQVKLTGCGRTDAGVHALNYVCNFKTNARIPAEKYPIALNTLLPDDIVCKDAQVEDEDFCAILSSHSKRYVYRIWNAQLPDAFVQRYSWHYKYPLNVEAMQEAAKAFVGEHDFLGFAAAGFSVKTTIRTIYSLDVRKSGNMIEIDVCGNGFLYNMVRIIAGTLVYVGGGRIKAEDMGAIIASKDRKRAGITAPAKGLCLKEVYYREGR